jgi:hypothetical protein
MFTRQLGQTDLAASALCFGGTSSDGCSMNTGHLPYWMPSLKAEGISLIPLMSTGRARPKAGIHPLIWRPEIFGRTHHLCRSNRAEGAKPQRETGTEDGSVRHH